MIPEWLVGWGAATEVSHNAGLLLDHMVDTEDMLVPAQWAHRHQAPASGEKSLWLAVLTEAVCLATRRLTTQVTARHRDEAKEWIAADGTAIGSFRWVCDVLDLDADWVRVAIAEGQEVKMRELFTFLHKATNSTNAARAVA